MRKTDRQPSQSVRRVKPIPPTEPAARDEGPRLIPLRGGKQEPPPMGKYLDLADVALGNDSSEPEDEKA